MTSAEELLRRFAEGERDFEGAELSGADLIAAWLTGPILSSANLHDALPTGPNLSWAKLRSADLSGANLSDTDLSGANLSDANLSGANLGGANLRGADLSGANLSGAKLLRAKLLRAKLLRANLREANLSNADLRGTNLGEANLSSADLRAADLTRANLGDANLSGAHLGVADLDSAKLRGAKLTGATLIAANATGADLTGADLSQADLTGADLRFVELTGAQLTEALLNGCAFDHDADLLAATWTTLKFGGTTYHREAVERGEQVLRIGQPDPLRFVFGVDGQLQEDDLGAVRHVLGRLHSAKGTRIRFEITEDREVLVVEGFGPTTQAGEAGALLQAVKQVVHEEMHEALAEHNEENRRDHDQQFMMLARATREIDPIVRLVERLELNEVQLRDDEEVERFSHLVRDRGLTKNVTIVDRTVRFARAFVSTPEAVELLLSFIGLDKAAKAIKAGVKNVKALKEREDQHGGPPNSSP